MNTKREMKKSIDERRRAADEVLRPQWKRCFWTRPFGHVRDGSVAKDIVGISDYSKVCLYCGKPDYGTLDNVNKLELHATVVGRYPIARAIPKREMTT